jgi:hypothetical protein
LSPVLIILLGWSTMAFGELPDWVRYWWYVVLAVAVGMSLYWGFRHYRDIVESRTDSRQDA